MASVVEMTELFARQQPPPPVLTTNTQHQRFVNPLHSMFHISVDFLTAFAKIIVTVCVLVASAPHEHVTLLLVWIVGYLCGSIASILLIGWRFYIRNNINVSPIASLVEDYYNLALHFFFGGWFIFGCILVFGADSPLVTQAPNLYRLAVALLIFSSIGYAMPFILYFARCCFFPCFFMVQDSLPGRRATDKSIRSLPTYKFQGNESGGGVVNRRLVDPEEAVCAICLETYENNDDLKELPCRHIFHVDCVDPWLKMNPACPVCKLKSGKRVGCWCWVFG